MSVQTTMTYTFFLLCLGGDMPKLERDYKVLLVPKIYALFPDDKPLRDMIVYLNDPNQIQGIPDISVFRHDKWAMLEVKREEKSRRRPNQGWYINTWGQYIFTAFISPENEQEVLHALQQQLAG